MKSKANWIPLTLTLTLFPGMGHFYLKQKFRGSIFAGLAVLLCLAILARFFSVLFAVANVRGIPRQSGQLEAAWDLLAQSWQMDWPILVTLLGALMTVWGLAALDILVQIKRRP